MLGTKRLPPEVQRALRWDATGGFIGGLFNGAIFPFLGVILRRDLHGSAFLIALLGSAFAIGNLFGPFVAHHSRNQAKLPYVLWLSAISRSGFIFMLFAGSALSFTAITVLACSFGSLGSPAYAAVIRDAYPLARRGQLMGIVRVLFVGGSMTGALIAGWALHYVDYRTFFPLAALVGLTGTAAFSRLGVQAAPGEPAAKQARIWEVFRSASQDRPFRTYSLAFFLYALGNLILSPVFPVFQVDELHISTRWVSYLATTASAFGMIAYLYWGRVLDRQGPFRLLLSAMLISSISPITYYLAHDVRVLLIASMAQGIANAGTDLGYVNASIRFAQRELVTSYAAVFAFLQAMRGIPGPFIGAALSDWLGPRPVFLLILALWIASAVVAFYGLRHMGKGRQEE